MDMKIAIMQPYFFPYIGYFQLINAVDKFIIYDDVNYINKGWINRNRILINKQPCIFSIPLKKASQNRKIYEIEMAADRRWKQKFIKTLEIHYKKAPNFEIAISLIKTLLAEDYQYIVQLILHCLHELMLYLQLNTKLIETSKVYNVQPLKGKEKILEICKKEKATRYINPIGGQNLYSKEEFKQKGIDLNFLKTNNIYYKQYGNEFVPDLSIIDLLMFNSQVKLQQMITEYELI